MVSEVSVHGGLAYVLLHKAILVLEVLVLEASFVDRRKEQGWY